MNIMQYMQPNFLLIGQVYPMLEQFHISCLQRMLRLRWWDKIPHVQIRHRAHCLSMEATIAERQLRWTGHVIRMPEHRLPRRVLYGELKEGRRSVGGQYKRFKDFLKATLKKNAITPDQLETLAADRKGWRDNLYHWYALHASNSGSRLKMSVVVDGMSMLLRTEKTTSLICVPAVAVHVA